MNLKRTTTALLALLLLITGLPAASMAAAPTTVYVGNANVTTGYDLPRPLFGGTVQYVGGVLTLTDVKIPANAYYHHATSGVFCSVFGNGDISIVLNGANSITGTTNTAGSSNGISIHNGSLQLSGPGRLFALAGTGAGGDSSGIFATGNITLAGGTITSTGGKALTQSNGMSANTLTIKDGTLTGQGGDNSSISVGLNSGDITMSGGTLRGNGGIANAVSAGVQARNIRIMGGSFTGFGGAAETASVGVQAADLSISQGRLFVSGESARMSYGAILSNGSSLRGGSITLKGNVGAMNKAPAFDAGKSYTWKANFLPSTPMMDPIPDSSAAYSFASGHLFIQIMFENGDIAPVQRTYNAYDAATPGEATMWLSGTALPEQARLSVTPLRTGADYKALRRLASKKDVLRVFDLALESTKSTPSGAMQLTLRMGEKAAGQPFSLVYRASNAAYTYLNATANASGEVTFGPLQSLSPCMLVRGTLAQVPAQTIVDVPKTG